MTCVTTRFKNKQHGTGFFTFIHLIARYILGVIRSLMYARSR